MGVRGRASGTMGIGIKREPRGFEGRIVFEGDVGLGRGGRRLEGVCWMEGLDLFCLWIVDMVVLSDGEMPLLEELREKLLLVFIGDAALKLEHGSD